MAAQAAQSEPDTYTTKTDRCSRRFRRCFSSGASQRLRAIFFINAGSDRQLRTSPSRGYCWGLDLRVDSRRSIPPSEMLPTSFAGLQRRKASTPEGRRSLVGSPQAREPTFGGPKDAVARPEAQARRARPSKEPGRSPSDAMVTVDHSEMAGGLRRTSAPEGCQSSG